MRIDKWIRDEIAALNYTGMPTIACCQGHWRPYLRRGKRLSFLVRQLPYIVFWGDVGAVADAIRGHPHLRMEVWEEGLITIQGRSWWMGGAVREAARALAARGL